MPSSFRISLQACRMPVYFEGTACTPAICMGSSWTWNLIFRTSKGPITNRATAPETAPATASATARLGKTAGCFACWAVCGIGESVPTLCRSATSAAHAQRKHYYVNASLIDTSGDTRVLLLHTATESATARCGSRDQNGVAEVRKR